MQILLNDKPQEVATPSVTSLKEIIDHVSDHIPEHMLITTVKLNGKQLDDDWIQQQDGVYVMEDDKLELHTRDAAELGREIFANTREQFQIIRDNFEQIAEMFRMDDSTTANASLAQSVDNLQAYFRVIHNALLLQGRNFSELIIDNQPATQFIDGFSAKLTELIETQQGEDWVLLADIIEYELSPLLKQIDSIYS